MSTLDCTVTTGKDVSGLVLVTNTVSMDEPCFGLAEVHLQSPGSRGFHRYQVIAVVRNDRPVQFMRDMGLASNFHDVDQFRVPGGVPDDDTGRFEIVHTVGELFDIADYLRAGYIRPPEMPRTDLIGDWMLQQEEQMRCVLGASTFSINHKIQRS